MPRAADPAIEERMPTRGLGILPQAQNAREAAD